jgi:holo-[acyl-carrier protein] synthase
MILAHGIDLVDIGSTERLLADPTDQFLIRCFTPRERADAGDGFERPARLSGRFAVKEAVLKALGTGFGSGIAFTDVEVIRLDTGAPSIVLRGKAAEVARVRGISSWLVSTSHEGSMAIGSVIALGDQAGPK